MWHLFTGYLILRAVFIVKPEEILTFCNGILSLTLKKNMNIKSTAHQAAFVYVTMIRISC